MNESKMLTPAEPCQNDPEAACREGPRGVLGTVRLLRKRTGENSVTRI